MVVIFVELYLPGWSYRTLIAVFKAGDDIDNFELFD